jgi:hypothetical protein
MSLEKNFMKIGLNQWIFNGCSKFQNYFYSCTFRNVIEICSEGLVVESESKLLMREDI